MIGKAGQYNRLFAWHADIIFSVNGKNRVIIFGPKQGELTLKKVKPVFDTIKEFKDFKLKQGLVQHHTWYTTDIVEQMKLNYRSYILKSL
jgi:hypothetical protein